MDSFLKLIDRLIALLSERRRTRQQAFSAVIEPLFDEFQAVVDDYFCLLN